MSGFLTPVHAAVPKVVLLAAMASLVAACAGALVKARPIVPAVGCYQFEWGRGASRLGLPWGLVLEDRPLEAGWPPLAGREGVRRALTATSPTEREDHPFGYWLPSGADSIEVGYPGGGGVVLALERRGQNLFGQGRPVGDAVRPGESPALRAPVPVVARRVLCGAS